MIFLVEWLVFNISLFIMFVILYWIIIWVWVFMFFFIKFCFVLLVGSSLVGVSVLYVCICIVLVLGWMFIVIECVGLIKLIDVCVFFLLVCIW